MLKWCIWRHIGLYIKWKLQWSTQILYIWNLHLDMVFESGGICLQYKHMKSLFHASEHLKNTVRCLFWGKEGKTFSLPFLYSIKVLWWRSRPLFHRKGKVCHSRNVQMSRLWGEHAKQTVVLWCENVLGSESPPRTQPILQPQIFLGFHSFPKPSCFCHGVPASAFIEVKQPPVMLPVFSGKAACCVQWSLQHRVCEIFGFFFFKIKSFKCHSDRKVCSALMIWCSLV